MNDSVNISETADDTMPGPVSMPVAPEDLAEVSAAKNPKSVLKWSVVGVTCAALLWGGWAVTGAKTWSGVTSASAATKASGPQDPEPTTVVAVVNGQKVVDSEIRGLINSGVDRAIVIDRYINKVLAAERGRELYSKEADATLKAAEREVLATLYTTRRIQELRDAVTDEQIQDYYKTNVRDENFKLFKVSYYLSGQINDAQTVLKNLKDGDSKALAQLKPLIEQGDGYAAATALPYNLGRVAAKMKKGEFSEVLQLRNGLLVLRVDDVKQLDKPTVDAVKDEIRQTLALQRFNQELEQARKQAKVELG
ncbi:peptidylprolyl isomerase [Limnobacter humi]|uniref:Peptidylprolyl isomerase n=1 Tax=Limnobacter humi TaxID=1778671 RepID=A0ABT1WJ88_9BURK|nr:peptidylprolyl isomerase [Limnobacter humi]MCQ8897575.1 peptidylprolyl isomerase [Limnobacter humi]